MRVVITGGSGFIGRALTRSLVRDGHTVVVLTRHDAGRSKPPAIERVTWDGQHGASWASKLDGADVLINLAGENIASGPWTRKRRARILQSRLWAGQACLDALSHVSKPPACLVQASAVGFYGDRGGSMISEQAGSGHGFLADVAAQWEASTVAAEQLGVRRVVIRTALVLGRDGGALPRLLPAFRLFAGGPLGSGRQCFPWVHLDDVVGAIRFLMDHADASGPFNLAAPGIVTQKEWAATLGRTLSRPALLRVPGWLVRLFLGDLGQELLLNGACVVPTRLVERGYAFRFPDLADALADLLQGESFRRGS